MGKSKWNYGCSIPVLALSEAERKEAAADSKSNKRNTEYESQNINYCSRRNNSGDCCLCNWHRFFV